MPAPRHAGQILHRHAQVAAPRAGSAPTTRTNQSFHYGNEDHRSCPGSSFNDGVCDAEFIADQFMMGWSAVEPKTWGSVKALYR